MKRIQFYFLLVLSLLSSSCIKDMRDRIDALENNSKQLETSVDKMQISIDSLKAVIGKFGNDTLSFTVDSDVLVPMSPNSSRTINYRVKSSSSERVNVETIAQGNIRAVLTPSEDGKSGTIEITTAQTIEVGSKVVVLVSDGKKALMFSLQVEEIGLIIKGESELKCGNEGGYVTMEYLSNMSCVANIPEDAKSWLSVSGTKALTERHITLEIKANEGAGRSAEVTLSTPEGSCSIKYTVIQEASESYEIQMEREVLEQLFHTAGGEEWVRHDNWCSSSKVGTWYGISTNDKGYVTQIKMEGNNMQGVLPDEIWGFKYMQRIILSGNGLSIHIPGSPDSLSAAIKEINLGNYSNLIGTNVIRGGIPSSIGKMQNLVSFRADNVGLTGTIPDELWSIGHLQMLELAYNRLEGEISPAIGNARHLKELDLSSNNLEGSIPEEFTNLTELTKLEIGNTTGLIGYPELKLESNHITGLPSGMGKMKNLELIWMNGTGLEALPESICDCEKLWQIDFGTYQNSGNYANNLGRLPERIGQLKKLAIAKFDNAGLEGPLPESISELENVEMLSFYNVRYTHPSFPGKNEITGTLPDVSKLKKLRNLFLEGNLLEGNIPDCYADNPELTGLFLTYNKFSGTLSEKVVDCANFPNWNLDPQREGYGLKMEMYESKDYSRNGNVIQLQKASKGNGIDLVIMGDAFVDKELTDGTYGNIINRTMEDFFGIEPYASFRDWFNVYEVELVSKNNKFGLNAKTALNTRFGEGTYISGDDELCFEYTEKAVGGERMDEVLVITVINRKYYAGTCWMYHPETGQYGNGPAIAYFPLGTDDEMFTGLVLHEAAGHGFTKLDDEYFYEGSVIPESELKERKKLQEFGWFSNVDFTDNPDKVRWSRFLHDSRYSNEGLGIFEGGATYGRGVWRSTENSIMRYNTGRFNAPSREAIYKRIHKLGEGPLWEYDYEDFVAYDEINRIATKSISPDMKKYAPLNSPVIMKKDWRNAVNNGKAVRTDADMENADIEKIVFSNSVGNHIIVTSGNESNAVVNFDFE